MLTFITILRWLGGIFVLMAAGGALLTGSRWGASLVLLAGLVLLPPTARRLGFVLPSSLKGENQATTRALLTLPLGLALCVVGVIWSAVEEMAQKSAQATVAATSPSAPPVAAAPMRPAAPREPVKPAAAPAPPRPVEVDPDVLMLIEGEGWDRTRREWGAAGVAKINRLMPLAAARVAASKECDGVAVAGYSDRSTAPSDPVFFVDCNNKRRFYVTEADLESEAPAVSRNAQVAGVSSAAAVEACERSVRKQLNLPSSYDRDLLNTSVYRSPYGTLTVQFTFQAKNRLGVEANLRATCSVDDRGVQPAEIVEM